MFQGALIAANAASIVANWGGSQFLVGLNMVAMVLLIITNDKS